ncbi:putative pectinesterasepectinesterase inhibitor 7 [Nicotiana attenuata]|uniref:Pectinesterasepectinesterase inhibitor 7 n=1 Tax=Nicotiana attenuata TaxID=49451 RepID=A0A314KY65_NICAT|nr:putative pectinesterasepectinesterase inhibitor 7 [Nicotiana attenuata]
MVCFIPVQNEASGNFSKNQVLVRDVVTVNQDGSGNFSTITDAVAAAPNNSMSTSGYFLIYITAGIYEEYVSIAKTILCTPRQI